MVISNGDGRAHQVADVAGVVRHEQVKAATRPLLYIGLYSLLYLGDRLVVVKTLKEFYEGLAKLVARPRQRIVSLCLMDRDLGPKEHHGVGHQLRRYDWAAVRVLQVKRLRVVAIFDLDLMPFDL